MGSCLSAITCYTYLAWIPFFNEILTMFVAVRINHDQMKKLPVMVENVLVGYHHDIYGQLHHTNCGSHNLGKFVCLFVFCHRSSVSLKKSVLE